MPRLTCNIDTKGRRIRFGIGLVFLIAAVVVWFTTRSVWASALLLGSAAFAFFEASRGWCAARALGIKMPW